MIKLGDIVNGKNDELVHNANDYRTLYNGKVIAIRNEWILVTVPIGWRLYSTDYKTADTIDNIDEYLNTPVWWYNVEDLLVMEKVEVYFPNGDCQKLSITPVFEYKFDVGNIKYEVVEISEDKKSVWVEDIIKH